MKVFVVTNETDYALLLESADFDLLSSANAALQTIIPRDALAVDGGLLRIRSDANVYLLAWLHAVEITHHARVIWLPVAATA